MLKKYGFLAEDKAILYLKDKNYEILARNRSFYGVEIDILCKKGDTYYLFEIKRVKKQNYMAGYFPFSYRQQQRYQKAIRRWYFDIQKIQNVSVGLLILDENLSLIDMIEHLF